MLSVRAMTPGSKIALKERGRLRSNQSPSVTQAVAAITIGHEAHGWEAISLSAKAVGKNRMAQMSNNSRLVGRRKDRPIGDPCRAGIKKGIMLPQLGDRNVKLCNTAGRLGGAGQKLPLGRQGKLEFAAECN